MSYTITCIGSGNMGGALMKAAARAIGGAAIGVTDADTKKAAAFAAELGGGALAANTEAAAEGRYVLLAVKPQVAQAVLAEIGPVLARRLQSRSPAILVSIVAGLSIDTMKRNLAAAGCPETQPIIRLMPNTPALVAKGMIALAPSPEVSPEAVQALEHILSQAGLIDRIDEKYMDAVTALSGSGPAFVYLFIEALADAGVRAGLSRDKALRYASRTVLGAAAMVEETGQHPGVLKDGVTSPAGTTIAGIAALEDRGFRGTVMAAVDAAFRRAQELG
ncbi:pyrroline-5-carboxylate reductase [Gracilinema caldarium]|uniref:Pyrroline-5-carboxylate reductase n=1 Tax=Gracilinema caldarium (strain ATCC 51460 / DSM 7334 / H1) TaxID=744872 RepID=F8F0D2_GRAC1|nr:pyrroline-5-carboxylate reductase [Gracilinema caldarium]AEJ18996.1 pyrroline-5-carboxylate reductase [Gracilinema caldarium DSM 7334]